MNKECKKHGLTPYKMRADGRWRCGKCASESVTKRRRKMRSELIVYKGGECKVCGYNKCIAALEFHHLDPTKKDLQLSGNGQTRSLDALKKEADKCILVCANCHREIHWAGSSEEEQDPLKV